MAVGVPVLIGVGLPFVVVYFLNRQENWWALIPAWVLTMVAVMIFDHRSGSGRFDRCLRHAGDRLPFLVVYLINREHWWALIPGGIMVALAAVILLSTGKWAVCRTL